VDQQDYRRCNCSLIYHQHPEIRADDHGRVPHTLNNGLDKGVLLLKNFFCPSTFFYFVVKITTGFFQLNGSLFKI
jgi:hypothetical protein